MIGHHLFDGHADRSDVPGEPPDPHIEQIIGIARAHVQEEEVRGADEGDSNISHREEDEHLLAPPQRFDELPAEAYGDNVCGDGPKVRLEEAEGEGGPEGARGGEEEAGGDGEGVDAGAPPGETVAEHDAEADGLDGAGRVAEQSARPHA